MRFVPGGCGEVSGHCRHLDMVTYTIEVLVNPSVSLHNSTTVYPLALL